MVKNFFQGEGESSDVDDKGKRKAAQPERKAVPVGFRKETQHGTGQVTEAEENEGLGHPKARKEAL